MLNVKLKNLLFYRISDNSHWFWLLCFYYSISGNTWLFVMSILSGGCWDKAPREATIICSFCCEQHHLTQQGPSFLVTRQVIEKGKGHGLSLGRHLHHISRVQGHWRHEGEWNGVNTRQHVILQHMQKYIPWQKTRVSHWIRIKIINYCWKYCLPWKYYNIFLLDNYWFIN